MRCAPRGADVEIRTLGTRLCTCVVGESSSTQENEHIKNIKLVEMSGRYSYLRTKQIRNTFNYCRRCHESYIFRTRIMSINLSIKLPNKLIRHFTKFLNFDWCSLACIACWPLRKLHGVIPHFATVNCIILFSLVIREQLNKQMYQILHKILHNIFL